MSQSRLTLNIQVSYVQNWGATLDFLRKLNPVAVIACIDNMSAKNRIDELKAALPNTKIIARCIIVVHDNGVQKELDGGMHLAPQAVGDTNYYVVSPDNFLNTWESLGKNGLMLSYMNEPQIANATDMTITRQVAHMKETINKATTRGISLCVGNWGAGHYLTPAFDDILRLLSQHRDLHALGLHLYAPIDTLTALTIITTRCTTLGIKPPRIHVTEYGYDSANADDKLNGYKSRGYTGLQFATWEKVNLNNIYKYYFVDDVLQSVATFTWGNEASWKNFNVEADGEWQSDILDAAEHGVLSFDTTQPPPVVVPPPPPAPNVATLTPAQVADFKLIRANWAEDVDMNTHQIANLQADSAEKTRWIALIDSILKAYT